MTRPACVWCGKPLRRYRYRDRAWAKDKKPWGDYGDGLFCGLRCGYRWAKFLLELSPGSPRRDSGIVADARSRAGRDVLDNPAR